MKKSRIASPFKWAFNTENESIDPVFIVRKKTVDLFCNEVCKFFDISKADFVTKRRFRELVHPRQIFCYIVLSQKESYRTYSVDYIAKQYFGQDHSTVVYAKRKISDLLSYDRNVQSQVKKLEGVFKFLINNQEDVAILDLTIPDYFNSFKFDKNKFEKQNLILIDKTAIS